MKDFIIGFLILFTIVLSILFSSYSYGRNVWVECDKCDKLNDILCTQFAEGSNHTCYVIRDKIRKENDIYNCRIYPISTYKQNNINNAFNYIAPLTKEEKKFLEQK